MVYKVRISFRRRALFDRVVRYFSSPPVVPVIAHLSSSTLSAIHVSPQERKIKGQAIVSLSEGIVEPHFDRSNLSDRRSLAEIIRQVLDSLHPSGRKVALLIPEICLRVFVLGFDSLPAQEKEREKLIRWRAKKQMPVLPEDVRVAHQVLSTNGKAKVLACLGRSAVLSEYEELFSRLGYEVGVISSPTLSLLNLIDWTGESDVLVVNVEEDSMSLVAVTRSEISLYRNKTFAAERRPDLSLSQKVEAVVKEIENTVFFVEDREKSSLRSLWIRVGLREGQEEILTRVGRRIPFTIHALGASSMNELPLAERTILAPLFGQIP